MSIIETIKIRRSCRTYRDSPVETDKLAELKAFLEANTAAPFGSPVRFELLDFNELEADELRPLGTYGVIKGAKLFIIGAVGKRPKAMEDYGYCMEKNILKATALGLGTCWLGGTFRRSGFARMVNLSDGELLPAISPVGYPGKARSLTDRFFRFSAGSNERKEWSELFFDGDPETPLPGNPPAGMKRRSNASGSVHRLRTNSPGESSGTGAPFTSTSPGRPDTTE